MKQPFSGHENIFSGIIGKFFDILGTGNFWRLRDRWQAFEYFLSSYAGLFCDGFIFMIFCNLTQASAGAILYLE